MQLGLKFELDHGLNAENATTELWPPNPKEFEIAADDLNTSDLGARLGTSTKKISFYVEFDII